MKRGSKRGQLNGLINMWDIYATCCSCILPPTPPSKTTSGLAYRTYETVNHMGHHGNDCGHYHILLVCQYLRVQYLSNICQVMDDSSLPVENDGVVGDLFVEVEERKKRRDVKIKGALLKMTKPVCSVFLTHDYFNLCAGVSASLFPPCHSSTYWQQNAVDFYATAVICTLFSSICPRGFSTDARSQTDICWDVFTVL